MFRGHPLKIKGYQRNFKPYLVKKNFTLRFITSTSMESVKDQTVMNWDTYPQWRRRRPWPAEISWGTGAPFPCLECWSPAWPPPLCSHPHLLEEPENLQQMAEWFASRGGRLEVLLLVDLFTRKKIFITSFNLKAIIPK